MIDTALSLLVVCLVPASWLSAAVLIHAALKRPRIGALTERALVALAIAVMVTAGGILTVNRNVDYGIFTAQAARILFSLSVIVVGSVPLGWMVLWLTGRLGPSKP